jgi:hypothetical protein
VVDLGEGDRGVEVDTGVEFELGELVTDREHVRFSWFEI